MERRNEFQLVVQLFRLQVYCFGLLSRSHSIFLAASGHSEELMKVARR